MTASYEAGKSDGDIFIPYETFRKIYNTGDRVQWFTIAAYDDVDVIEVEKNIKATLKRIHKVSPDDERAFGGFNLGEIFNKIVGFSKGMTLLSLIVGIATILAGVIGIGNILLISVKERTKELGVRKALGAQPSEIIKMILTESIFITSISGFAGMIIGIITLNSLDSSLQEYFITRPQVNLNIAFVATLILIIFGVIAGYIPAKRAAQIKPIVALRDE